MAASPPKVPLPPQRGREVEASGWVGEALARELPTTSKPPEGAGIVCPLRQPVAALRNVGAPSGAAEGVAE